jgi:hypothetical protein
LGSNRRIVLLDLGPVHVAGTAPLADAATVYAKVGSGGQRGRWLLVP